MPIPGELKARCDRLHPFADLAAIHATLEQLVARDLVAQLPRRPGQKEERDAAHRLSDDEAPEPAGVAPAVAAAPPGPVVRAPGRPMPAAPAAPEAAAGPGPPLDERVARLEAEVAQLRAELRALYGRS